MLTGIMYATGILAFVVGAGVFFGAPYVPTKRRDLRRMFDSLYHLKSTDTLLDMGSGDGIVLLEASRRGASAIGYEINPVFYALSKLRLRRMHRVSVRLVNAWLTPFPHDATVVYIFSVGKDGRRLEKKLQTEANRLGRPLTLICYGNPLPNGQHIKTFEAYYMYRFEPLHLQKA